MPCYGEQPRIGSSQRPDGKAVLKNLTRRILARLNAESRHESEELIRNELFSIERLEQHAESLAAAQPVTPKPGAGRQLAPRLRDNGRVLLAVYRGIGKAIHDERAITPAAEWLVDNFHIVEEQIRDLIDTLLAEEIPEFYKAKTLFDRTIELGILLPKSVLQFYRGEAFIEKQLTEIFQSEFNEEEARSNGTA